MRNHNKEKSEEKPQEEQLWGDDGMELVRREPLKEITDEHVQQVRQGNFQHIWDILKRRIEVCVNASVFKRDYRDETWLHLISKIPDILEAYTRRIDPVEDCPARLWVFIDGESKKLAKRFVQSFFRHQHTSIDENEGYESEYRHPRRLEPQNEIDEYETREALEFLRETLSRNEQITFDYVSGEQDFDDLATAFEESTHAINYIVRKYRETVLRKCASALGIDMPDTYRTIRRVYNKRSGGNRNVPQLLQDDGGQGGGASGSDSRANPGPAQRSGRTLPCRKSVA